VVFALPVILSIGFASFVLGDVLAEENRKLNLWPFKNSGKSPIEGNLIEIIGLQQEYSVMESIDIAISIKDPFFDCGDLYLAIYDLNSMPKEVLTQSGFFNQCFGQNNVVLPINDKFSEKIESRGNYEIVIEMTDNQSKKIISTSDTFTVK